VISAAQSYGLDCMLGRALGTVVMMITDVLFLFSDMELSSAFSVLTHAQMDQAAVLVQRWWMMNGEWLYSGLPA
jgi:hypothetical protein